MDEYQRTLLHESGHAICGRICGQEASDVVVFGSDEAHTRHYLPSPRQVDRMTRAEFDTFVEGVGITDLAGSAALAAFGDPDPRRGAARDWDRALEVARQLAPLAPDARRDAMYARALALCRQHRSAIERFSVTLGTAHGRLAGPDVRVALDAALGGWRTPRFDRESEWEFQVARRELFDEHYAELGPDPSFIERLDLWRACEEAVRSDRPLYRPRPAAGLGWTAEQRHAAQQAYLAGGLFGLISAARSGRLADQKKGVRSLITELKEPSPIFRAIWDRMLERPLGR